MYKCIWQCVQYNNTLPIQTIVVRARSNASYFSQAGNSYLYQACRLSLCAQAVNDGTLHVSLRISYPHLNSDPRAMCAMMIVGVYILVPTALAINWGEPERALHDVLNGDFVCPSVRVYMYVHIPYILVF